MLVFNFCSDLEWQIADGNHVPFNNYSSLHVLLTFTFLCLPLPASHLYHQGLGVATSHYEPVTTFVRVISDPVRDGGGGGGFI
jgi:hypothetical protein